MRWWSLPLLSSTLLSATTMEPGVGRTLAQSRNARISELRYDLKFSIPEAASAPIQGSERLRFRLKDSEEDLVLDFLRPGDSKVSLHSLGRPVPFRFDNEHLVIPKAALRPGFNELEIRFASSDPPFNRHADFLYTLFVPARAREAFPCFDQPDLKARFRLSLDIPSSWTAVANAPELSRAARPQRRLEVRFAETKPLSTYQFAFVAGRFQIERAVSGRPLRFFHRETDKEKLSRNRDQLFALSQQSLDWLEDYTQIPYPFGKLDFVLIPSFQYGGMEHPGVVYFNESKLLLEESATRKDELRRAELIAHEMAHMWFGNLVTMRWFDDVWLKEVFANFLAAKSVDPFFSDIDHRLRFLMGHHPGAYAVDRTEGTHPILQGLDNLNEAGSLYGSIIYLKAPIVMRQLEALLGAERLREGLRRYLRAFGFGNAAWDELITILEKSSLRSLEPWSRIWVKEAGLPRLSADFRLDGQGRILELAIVQEDPSGKGRIWPQKLEVMALQPAQEKRFVVDLSQMRTPIPEAGGLETIGVLLNSDGMGYGLVALDELSRRNFLGQAKLISDPTARGAAWIALWDSMLQGRTRPPELLDAIVAALPSEEQDLIAHWLLKRLAELHWRFLSPAERSARAEATERMLWSSLGSARSSGLRSEFFKTFSKVAGSREALDRLERIWRGELALPGLKLSEEDMSVLAMELAVRGQPRFQDLLARQIKRVSNPDRKARLEFIAPALSADADSREVFFVKLLDGRNRRREEWVEEALEYLHHPLRAQQSLKHLRPGLDLLEEIHRTGDIFFPQAWVGATLKGHNSLEAARAVRDYLARKPGLAPPLRRLVLQHAHELFIASEQAATLEAKGR
ncbi:MAG: ERAP1-like C-terminal domain-containing protein [Elusimicrobia bacterium]|nr:ERAP1-like C-terminal domain-containing protein [Elusimicrobiota bacterium]